MTRGNIIAILGILKTAYPRFYANMRKSEAEETIALWQEMFSDTDIRVLTIAVKRLITHLEFPPTIADVKKEIQKMSGDKKSTMDYWQEAYKMMSNANHMTVEKFNTYSQICKKFFGNVDYLRPYGSMENEYIINNVQPRFLKFAENYKKEENENAMLPSKYVDMVQELANKFEVKKLGGTIDV